MAAGTEKKHKKLERTLGLSEALTIGIGTMVGAGIFVFPGLAAGEAGVAAILSFVLGGAIALLVALSSSELATAMPENGGAYYYVSRIFGANAGFIVGVGQWVGLVFASAFYLTGFAQYMIEILEEVGLNLGDPMVLIAFLIAIILTLVNVLGTKGAGKLQNQVVISLAAILVLLFGYGILDATGLIGEAAVPDTFAPKGYWPVLTTTALIFTSYLGFVQIANVAGEIKNPVQNLPRAMIGSVIVVMLLYVAALFVSTSTLSNEELGQLGETAMVGVARELIGDFGALAILTAGLLATLSSANASILSSSRAVYALSKDEMIPKSISKVNDRFGTPHIALMVVGVPMTGLTLMGRIEILAEVASFLHLIMYGMICITLIRIKYNRPWWYQPAFQSMGKWSVPVSGAIFSFGLIAFMEPLSIYLGFGVLVLSLIWYLLFVPEIVFSLPETAQKAYQIKHPRVTVAVDIENPNALPKALLKAFKNLKLLVLGYRLVPEQTSPEQSRKEFEDEAQENLNDVLSDLEDLDIEMESELVFTPNLPKTIKQYSDEYDSHAVLTAHPIESVDRLLVPIYSKGQVNRRIASVLRELSKSSELPISLLLLSGRGSESKENKEIEQLKQNMITELTQAGIAEDFIRASKAEVNNIAKAVSKISDENDVLILGEPEDIDRNSFFRTIHQKIEDAAECPVMVVLKEEDSE
ncbi:MAG: APC family permease [Balneolaceae bacterium]|nr:APC family permease [Balneolaceae bacterium]